MLRLVEMTKEKIKSFGELFSHKLAGSEAGNTFEQTGKMMREIKTQQAGSLADVMSLHQQTFRLIYYIMMDITDSRTACGFVDYVAKVTGRIGQLGGAPSDSWQTL